MTAELSTDAKARAVLAARGGRWERLLALLGLDGGRKAARQREASRWSAGGVGEAMTAAIIDPLALRGWRVLHDRALPGHGTANVDHVLIPPCGTCAVVIDSKRWSAKRGPVRLAGGRLTHAGQDRHPNLKQLATVERLLGAPVVLLVVVHGAPVVGGPFPGELRVGPVLVLEAGRLLAELEGLGRALRPDRAAAVRLFRVAEARLPRYVEGGR